MRPAWMTLAMGAVLALPASSCGGTSSSPFPTGDDPVELDASEFTAEIDNPWMPLRTGARWVYRVTYPDGSRRRVVVTVLDETRMVMGIEARVVREVETEGGKVIEDTFDWYAQDADQNVWYLGEDTKSFADGVSTAGSWEAGVGGALPGILFPGRPEVGTKYRQEVYGESLEDEEEILRLDERVQVPFGAFRDVVMTRDETPDEAEAIQLKFFVRDVGRVLAIDFSGSYGREELVAHTTP